MHANALPSTTAYAERTVTKAPAWHELVAADMLLNNLATGLFMAAAVSELVAPTLFTTIASWAYPIALVLLLADLGCLVLDLGSPLRFHHMLRVFKLSSPMSLGTWCLTAFSLFLTVLTLLVAVVIVGWLPADSPIMWWIRKLAVVGGLPFAFGSAAYKGVLFSTSAQPGWRDARWFGAYLMNSAITLGTGILLAIAALTGGVEATAMLRPAFALLVVLNLIVLSLMVAELYPLLAWLYMRGELRVAALLLLLTALVIPASLLLIGGTILVCVALASLILANLGVRVVLVRLPHLAITKPKPAHAKDQK